MKKFTIYNTRKNKLLEPLELMYDLEFIKKPSFFKNFLKKDKQKTDIYFYDSKLEKYNIELLYNSKLIIVNSQAQKQYLQKKLPTIDQEKIQVIYPYIDQDIAYNKSIKKEFKNLYIIEKDTKIIFFRSNHLSKNGLKSVFSIVSNLNNRNFTLVIESTKKEIASLKLQLDIMKINFNIILIEDYKNKNELFMISDIFIFPSSRKFFNTDILKAGFYKNGIFVSQNNYSSEIVDTFATIEVDDENSTIFKIDALLSNPSELKIVKDTNYNQLLNYSFSNSFITLKKYILNF